MDLSACISVWVGMYNVLLQVTISDVGTRVLLRVPSSDMGTRVLLVSDYEHVQ